MTSVTNPEWVISSNETNGSVRTNTNNICALGAYICAAIYLSYTFSSASAVIQQKPIVSSNQYSVSTNPTPTMMYDNGNIIVFSTNLDGVATMDWGLEKNYKVLAEIAALKSNWNENGANAFSDALIAKCKEIVKGLSIQPNIYPTAQDSIQFEWERDQGDYLEIELFEDGSCQMYMQRADGSWKAEEIDSTKIGEIIDGFVAENL